MHYSNQECKGYGFRVLTKGAPFAARSAKYAQGLKNPPYEFDHSSNLELIYFDPRLSAQNMGPPLINVQKNHVRTISRFKSSPPQPQIITLNKPVRRESHPHDSRNVEISSFHNNTFSKYSTGLIYHGEEYHFHNIFIRQFCQLSAISKQYVKQKEMHL